MTEVHVRAQMSSVLIVEMSSFFNLLAPYCKVLVMADSGAQLIPL